MLSAGFFRRLAFLTAFFAYLQIALGGVVRVSGSGLGCPDWPLCHGRPYPAADVHSIIEYSHRTVGSITGFLVILTFVAAWTVYTRRRPVVPLLATASLAAIGVEGVIGGVVVIRELQPWLVLVHLALAMIILGCLLATALMSLPESTGIRVPGFRRLAISGVVATYLLLLTGSTVVASGADSSCHSWPLCGGGFALDFSGANAFTMLHRVSVLLVSVLIIFVALRAIRITGLRRVAIATLAVLAVQIAVGAGAAVTDAAIFNGMHVAIATLVWSGMLSIALLTVARTDRITTATSLAVERGHA